MELWRKQALFASNVSRLIDEIDKRGAYVTFGDAFRSPEQAKLNAACGKGIVDSLHCKRLAVDLNFIDKEGVYLTAKEDYRKMGDFWKTLHPHNRWGGDFQHLVDSNHFEMQDI